MFIVDDASTDNSMQLVKKFTDPRIHVISDFDETVKLKTNSINGVVVSVEKEKKGPSSARNKALDGIRAHSMKEFEFIAYCDSDDRWKNNHLLTSVEYLTTEDCDMVYSDCDFILENGTPAVTYGVPYYEKFDRDNLMKQNFIYISTVVHKSKCLSVGGFDDWCNPMEDYDMWLRISKNHKLQHIVHVTATYMYKDTDSQANYYTAQQSEKSKIRVHLKNSIIATDLPSLKIQLEEILELKNNVVKTQRYEEAAIARTLERQIITRIDEIEGPQAIDGWLSIVEGNALANYAEGKDCLEIGSYKGKSSYYIAEKAKSLVCIDSFRSDVSGQTQFVDYTTLQEFLKNTSKFKNIIPIIGRSEDVSGQFKDEQFDMIFVDGMHDYESVSTDIKHYWPKLKIGGVMCFHDYQKDWPGVVEAFEENFGKPDAIHDNIAVVKKLEKINFEEKFKDIKLSKQKIDRLDGKFILMKNLNMTSDQVDKLPDNEFLDYVKAVHTGMEVGFFDANNIDLSDTQPSIVNKTVVISPWSHKFHNGKENPKNFPYWDELVKDLKKIGCYIIQIGVAGEKMLEVDEVILNASYERLEALLNQADTFISVDSFFPHFAHYHGKHGIVIFSQSDPNLFGYSENVNILKSRSYLRKEQFWLWTQAEYNKDAFVSSKDVLIKALEILNLQ